MRKKMKQIEKNIKEIERMTKEIENTDIFDLSNEGVKVEKLTVSESVKTIKKSFFCK